MPFLPIVKNSAGYTEWASVDDEGTGHHGGSGLGEWSSLIGIVTAIVGNILIALALNVQRYSHIQLNSRRMEARERAKGASKRVQDGQCNGYGAVISQPDLSPVEGEDDDDETTTETQLIAQSSRSSASHMTESSSYDDGPEVPSSYLKSPSWWLGQVLMTVGEMGNFLAYGFAPASIVSPLGVVALISNCVIAPIFFGEVFRKQDFWGVVIAVGGAITVVLSAKGEETKLNPHDVWDAITTMEFEIYMGVTIFLIIVLMWASPRYGNRTILIDLGLVGLFGGYTALTTKGVSSMLSSTLLQAFATPVTYGLVIVLLGTAIMQVRYVNKALQRFDSTQVIPIQFVLFTLSVIVGSAILYRDFERTTTEQAAKFIGGCLLTFFGVFLITRGRHPQDHNDHRSDDEDVEETIGLSTQEGLGPYNGSTEQARRGSTTTPPTSTDTSPLLFDNPWGHSVEGRYTNDPRLSQTISADSVPTVHSLASVAVSEPVQSSINGIPEIYPPSSPQRPFTPRLSTSRSHSHHYSNTFISPSPLSSTVSAVVADKLLRGDGSAIKQKTSTRWLRPNIRSSLFVPQGGDDSTGVSDPLLATNSEAVHMPEEDEQSFVGQNSKRGRTRSLSNTLGQLFGQKKRKTGNSTAGIGESQEQSPFNDSLAIERQVNN